MKIDWMPLLTTLGASTVWLAIVAFLVKAIVSNLFTKDLEKFKGELQLQAQIHHVRFSRLHERQAEVIHNLYKRIIRFRMLCFAPFTLRGKESETCEGFDNLDQIAEGLLEIHCYFGEHALYLPEQLRQKYRILFTDGIESSLKAISFMAATDAALKDLRPEWRKNVVENLLPKMRAEVAQIDGYIAELEIEFQRVIGLSDSSL